MNISKCDSCGRKLIRYGLLKSGKQRWHCTSCHSTGVQRIDTSAKHLGEFLAWLLSGNRQADMPGGGRSFRRRCTFHAFGTIKQATTIRPKLAASKELYGLGKQLLHVKDREQAASWIDTYLDWCKRWEGFLAQKTKRDDGGWEYTHERLVRARNSVNRLIGAEVLFTYTDPQFEGALPAMNNQIEGATNAPLRQLLRDHRGMRLTRRIKAIFWWCYMHTENPLPPAQILKIMPTDTQIEAQWEHASRTHPAAGVIPRWGDAIAWHDLHHTSPHRNNWD